MVSVTKPGSMYLCTCAFVWSARSCRRAESEESVVFCNSFGNYSADVPPVFANAACMSLGCSQVDSLDHLPLCCARWLQSHRFITAGPIRKLCAGGGVKRGDVCYGMLRVAACVDESDHQRIQAPRKRLHMTTSDFDTRTVARGSVVAWPSAGWALPICAWTHPSIGAVVLGAVGLRAIIAPDAHEPCAESTASLSHCQS